MNPPPPILPAGGQVTASASPTATAASIAFPPRCKTSTPTREAISLVDATIPCFARVGSRDAACCVIGRNAENRTINMIMQVRSFMCSLPTDNLLEWVVILNSNALSIQSDVPPDQPLSGQKRYYRSRTEKDSKRDLHFHTTT